MAYPSGYSATAAIARVRGKTNEQTLPNDTTIINFLNAAVEQVESELGGIYANTNLAVGPSQNSGNPQVIIPLPVDIQEILDMTYSIVLPSVAGAVIYNVTILEEENFMYAAAYQPANSGGPPQIAMVLSDTQGTNPITAGQLTIQVFPTISTNGYLNIYYKQRPVLWDANNLGYGTTLDSAYQEAAILLACRDVYESRQRTNMIKSADDLFDKQLEKMRSTIRKRTRPRWGQVRDVTGTIMNFPWWYQQQS